MKITKETRKVFINEYYYGLGRHKKETDRHSFCDLKKVVLLLKEFNRIQSLKRDLSCGAVDVVMTGALEKCGLTTVASTCCMLCFKTYARGLKVFFSGVAKRKGDEIILDYSRKILSLLDCYQFLFNSFFDFALKSNSISMKKCIINITYKEKTMFLKFICK
jgi:hypothetical protein